MKKLLLIDKLMMKHQLTKIRYSTLRMAAYERPSR